MRLQCRVCLTLSSSSALAVDSTAKTVQARLHWTRLHQLQAGLEAARCFPIIQNKDREHSGPK